MAEAWAPNVWFKARSSLAHSWASSVLGSQFRTLVLQPSHEREVGFFFSSLLASVHTMCTQSVLFPTGFSEGDRYIFYKLFCWIFFFFLNRINSFFIVSLGSGYLVYRRFRQDFMNFVYTLRF